jgi:acyl transferase domain-containing protein
VSRFLSPDGRCYTFDSRANGYARGEGVGVVYLKPLADAIRDGDTIRGVIRNTGVNQDGKTAGITLPSRDAQEALMRSVYKGAGLNPLETSYVEAHGTGTPAGDPLEAAAISNVFGPGRPIDEPLIVGSIKTNVGHLEGASGVAGLIKTILMMENQLILPNRNFEKANERIPLKKWKLKVRITDTIGTFSVTPADVYIGTNYCGALGI